MSNNPSGTTKSLATRVPIEVWEIIQRRIKKHPSTISEYLRKRITYDVLRRHERVNK